MTPAADPREKVARAICRETCAYRGEPPCFDLPGAWPNPDCNEPGCHALADAALAAPGVKLLRIRRETARPIVFEDDEPAQPWEMTHDE